MLTDPSLSVRYRSAMRRVALSLLLAKANRPLVAVLCHFTRHVIDNALSIFDKRAACGGPAARGCFQSSCLGLLCLASLLFALVSTGSSSSRD